jgi:hypothetical protein
LSLSSRPPAANDNEVAATNRARPRFVLPLVFLSALAVGLLFIRRAPDSYDSNIMIQVTQNLVQHGSLHTTHDWLGLNSPYSSYGIGLSLAMVPLYEVGKFAGINPVSAVMSVNAIVFALLATTLVAWARLRRLSWQQAMAVGGAIALGSALLPYVATGFSELSVAWSVTLGLMAIDAARQRRSWAPIATGVAAGVALLMRTDSALLVFPVIVIGALVTAEERERYAALASVALAPFVIVWGWYNAVRFGAPWRLGYPGQPFNQPFLTGLSGLLASPARGLVFYAPIIAVAAWGAVLAWRRDRLLVTCAVLLLVARLLFYATWWAWYGGGGWGPRMLVPAMPGLLVGMEQIARRWSRLATLQRATVGAVVGVTVMIQVIGASVNYLDTRLAALLGQFTVGSGPILQRVTAPAAERRINAVLFGWHGFPITDEGGRLLRRQTLAGRFLSPHIDRPVVAALLLVAVSAAFAAVRVVRGSGGGPAPDSRSASPMSKTA